jgi:hypothetical protein
MDSFSALATKQHNRPDEEQAAITAEATVSPEAAACAPYIHPTGG